MSQFSAFWPLIGGAVVGGFAGAILAWEPNKADYPPAPAPTEVKVTGAVVRVWVDPDTSCQYLVVNGYAMTPRLHSDGVQVCMGEDKLGAQLPDYHEGEQP